MGCSLLGHSIPRAVNHRVSLHRPGCRRINGVGPENEAPFPEPNDELSHGDESAPANGPPVWPGRSGTARSRRQVVAASHSSVLRNRPRRTTSNSSLALSLWTPIQASTELIAIGWPSGGTWYHGSATP